jgi:hypothetical protein
VGEKDEYARRAPTGKKRGDSSFHGRSPTRDTAPVLDVMM